MANTQSGAGGITFEDRGDPAAVDFLFDSFTKDGNWHDMDLSGIMPAGAVLVMLRFKGNCRSAGGRVRFRTNGNTNTDNVSMPMSQVVDKYFTDDVWVVPDDNGVIEYNVDDYEWNDITVTVAGWFV